tara:strand:+ start:462 stop:1244 length:783 start_codon:yes stop_codon:yes gene_type:complete
MSIKSFIQILLILLIISIVGTVYYKYFDIDENIVEEMNTIEIDNKKQINELEKKISELELKNNELIQIVEDTKKVNKNLSSMDTQNKIINNDKVKTKKVITNKKVLKEKENEKKETKKDLVKDVAYSSIDQKGNKFYLLASSAKSNVNNKDVLDLINVRGEITSDKRDTIYIVSKFAEFNSVNSNSKFYDNVIINYQEKQITCQNFDINMESNKAIAYNDVIVTDPKSTIKAGMVEFDLKTKDIDIRPNSVDENIEVVTN